MTSEADRLRMDIEQTRADVGDDVDALAEKVDPRRVVERRMDDVRGTASAVKDKVMGTVDSVEEGLSGVGSAVGEAARMPAARTRGNPLAVGVIVFGLGWLLGSVLPMGERERQAARRAIDAAEPLKNEAMHAAGQVAEGMREPVQQASERLTESATASAESVKEAAADTVAAVAAPTTESRPVL